LIDFSKLLFRGILSLSVVMQTNALSQGQRGIDEEQFINENSFFLHARPVRFSFPEQTHLLANAGAAIGV
jgi:hypothetical protein